MIASSSKYFFSVPHKLPIPLEEFLYPVEQNHTLLSLYLRALATQTVRYVYRIQRTIVNEKTCNCAIDLPDEKQNSYLTKRLYNS